MVSFTKNGEVNAFFSANGSALLTMEILGSVTPAPNSITRFLHLIPCH